MSTPKAVVLPGPNAPVGGSYPQQQGAATDFREAGDGSPEYSFGRDRNRGARTLLVPWANPNVVVLTPAAAIWQAAKDFLGFTTVATQPGIGTKYLSRTLPAIHPDFQAASGLGTKALSFLAATDIERIEGIRPRGQDANKVGQFNEAKVRVVYDGLPYNLMDDPTLQTFSSSSGFPDESTLLRYIYAWQEPSGQALKFKSLHPIQWTIRSQAMEQGMNVPVYMADVYVVWYQVPTEAVPSTAIRDTIGKTNAADFGVDVGGVLTHYPGQYGAPFPGLYKKGTFICETPKIEKPYRMANGFFATDITYHFKWMPNGANYFYRVNFRQGDNINVLVLNVSQSGPGIDYTLTIQGASFVTGDWVHLFPQNPNLPEIGAWSVIFLGQGPGNATYTLVNSGANTQVYMNQAINGRAKLGPGWYPAAYKNGLGLVFPVADYTRLFQPEP